MIEFIIDTAATLPFLFGAYLLIELMETKGGDAIKRFLGRAQSVGPAAGALAGAIPQCGVSAAASSFYAGGVITVGTLIAVFLSTSDELIPVLLAERAAAGLMAKIVGMKIICALGIGFLLNGLLAAFRHIRREVSIGELCEHSRCGCHERKGILVPALIHTAEIFVFIAVVSGAIELCVHYLGEESLNALRLNRPFIGELVAGALGMIPNCAVSVAGAKLYLAGAMSPGALMASSFTGSGLGLLVLFRTNRDIRENLAILAAVYVIGVTLGWLCGFML